MGVVGHNGTILGEGTGSPSSWPERSFSSAEPLGWGWPATVAGRALTRDWPPHERDLCSARFDLKVDQTVGFRTAWVRGCVGAWVRAACSVHSGGGSRGCPTRCQDVVNWSNEDRRLLSTGRDRLWQALTATGRATGAGRPGSCCVRACSVQIGDCRRSRRSLSDSLERLGTRVPENEGAQPLERVWEGDPVRLARGSAKAGALIEPVVDGV